MKACFNFMKQFIKSYVKISEKNNLWILWSGNPYITLRLESKDILLR